MQLVITTPGTCHLFRKNPCICISKMNFFDIFLIFFSGCDRI